MADIHDNIELSDSDDDLLGITDTPLDIRSRPYTSNYTFSNQHRSPFHSSKIQGNLIKDHQSINTKISSSLPFQSSDNSNPPQLNTSSDDGWIHCRRQRKHKKYHPIIPSSISNSKHEPSSNQSISDSEKIPHDHIPTLSSSWNKITLNPETKYPPGLNINSTTNNSSNEIISVNSGITGTTRSINDSLCQFDSLIEVSNCKPININCISESSGLRKLPSFLGRGNKLQQTNSSGDLCNYIPTMEIIDINNSKIEIKQNRYQRMREIRGIIGFIVNVHDATNFDIDLEMPPELHEKYRDVISNQYTYQDLNIDFLENPNLNSTTEITPKIGTTYRCRLRGVGINQLAQNLHTWKSNQMCVEVKQLIDRTDGWITCTLSDIDVYQRLLVDIVINTSKGPINLRDYLLSRMEHEENPIFYPYSGKRSMLSSTSNFNTTSISGDNTYSFQKNRDRGFRYNNQDY